MKLPSVYEPQQYESDIYSLWEKGRAFEPENRGGDGYFSIVMPPPNANADLHIGFGLTLAIEDTIVRYQRMQGKPTLFVPGADHAGFETWVVYEKRLNQQGKSRFDFTREELYRQVWQFVEKNKQNFQAQIRALGASCDWTRFTYTLDDKVVNQTYKTFKQMWDEKLIYRGNRIVNFCTFHGTGFSDIEVVHEEEKTKLWQVAYPLADGSGEVVIATTRPETKLGQSALMVHPDDKRYKHLVDREVLQPLVPDKPIKIIADEYVDKDFGTGVVTVTPGHDPDDFEVAQRHNLPVIELITTEGKMSNNVPEQFKGLTVMDARQAVLEALKRGNWLRGEQDYVHTIGKCYKCGTPIEPLLREQWFVKMQPLAAKAIEALEANKITFYPANRRGLAIRYLKEIKDWNISRQIAWGIPIPAFQSTSSPDDWIFDERVSEETIEVKGQTYRRDPDVFDAWFSSSSWPYSTLNYPGGEEFEQFYPTSLMETAGEILYQWVARMIMLGLYTTKEVPFKEVYIHGLVLAEGGAKMSKSLGNMIDAMEAVKTYGSDALRMGLLAGRAPGVNRGYDVRRVEEARNFCNKLWNVARYVEGQVGEKHTLRADPEARSPADHWILQRLRLTAEEITKALDSYRLSEAYENLYHFIWHDLADWYVEASKSQPSLGLLAYVLESSLKIAHPFAPFLTETIWQTLAWEENNLLIIQKWPQVPKSNAKAAAEFEAVIQIVAEVRQITSALKIPNTKLYYRKSEVIAKNADLIKRLVRLSSVSEASEVPLNGLGLVSSGLDAWLDIEPETAQKYLQKLKDQQKDQAATLQLLESRLANHDYLAKAPEALVNQTKDQIEAEKARLLAIDTELDNFQRQLNS